jgi:hypothetical protein
VSARLPDALKDAIPRFTDGIPQKELAARATSLSERYRAGSDSHAIAGDRDVAAYLTTRLPATYAAMAAALTAVKERAPRFTPARLLDVGAGPGTASWAAAETWPQLESVTMLDRNLHLLAAARTLAGASPNTALRSAEITSADLATFLKNSYLPPSWGKVAARRAAAPCGRKGGLLLLGPQRPELSSTSSSPATPSPSFPPKPATACSPPSGTPARAPS